MKFIFTAIIIAFTFSLLQAQKKTEKITLVNENIQTQEIFYVNTGTKIKNGLYEKKFMGQTKVKGNYVNNQRSGKWIFTNYIVIEGSYSEDLMVGKWIYTKHKDTLSVLNFINGEMNGQQLGYFENGKIASKTNYINGIIDGVREYYYTNGNIKEISDYKNGLLEGVQRLYSEDGKSENKIYYHKNNPIKFERVKGDYQISNFKENLVNGTGKVELISQNEEEKPIVLVERNLKDSLLHGTIIGFNLSGNKSFEGEYENGYMIGKWKFYTDEGVLDHTTTYRYTDHVERDSSEFVTMNYNEPFSIVDNMPEFPGGDKHLRAVIGKNIKYPKKCYANKIQGRVLVQLIINLVGEVENEEVVKSVHPLLDKEAIRVVKELPNWVPGLKAGRPVKVRYTVPFSFKIN